MSKRMTESQIVAILKEADAGMAVKDICRKYSVANSTFYKWREKYGGMEASDCSGQVKLATVLETRLYFASALFGGNPPLC